MYHAALFLLVIFVAPALADWQSRYRTGEQLLADGQAEEALAELTTALREAPPAGRAAILDALGRAEYRCGRYRQAKCHFEAALHLWPVNSRERAIVFYNLGRACLELQEHTYAEEMFRRTLETRSGEAYVWQAIGQAQFQRGRKDAAEDSFRKAISLSDPENRPMMVSDLAMLFLEKRQYDQAAAIWREAIARTEPGQVRARMRHSLGVLQWACQQKDRAAVQLRLALAEMEAAVGPRHPDVASILEDYHEVLRKSGKTAAAERASAIRASFAAQGGDRRNTVDWRDLRR